MLTGQNYAEHVQLGMSQQIDCNHNFVEDLITQNIEVAQPVTERSTFCKCYSQEDHH